MYSKDELLTFSILNSLDELINPNFIYKAFRLSLNSQENLFDLVLKSPKVLEKFLIEKCKFNPNQREKILKIFDKNFLEKLKLKKEKIFLECEKNKINLLFLNDEAYPKNLKDIKRAPYVLYYKGQLNLEKYKTIAIVGTRKMTKKGENFCYEISKYLKENNYFNISGLALGVDTLGHIQTLGQTGAIIAQGLAQDIYPKENQKLAEKILANNGFILSELPLRTNISVNNLIRRNRIISGLASNIMICETDIKGGTVHTFKYAKEQGKKIFVADFNENFIQQFSKDLIVIKNSKDFEDKIKKTYIQDSLF